MRIFDTHVHLDAVDKPLLEGEIVLSVGYKHEVNILLPKLTKTMPFSVGIAPQVAMNELFDENHLWLKNIEKLIENPLCIGVGEIGLDNKWASSEQHRKKQLKWFLAQLKIAQEKDLPIIIHSRDAEKELVDILDKKDIRCVFHSFGGKIDTAERIIDNGWKIGINPLKSKNKKKVINKGVENLLIETDIPYIGKNFEDIFESANRISEVLSLSTAEVIKLTFDNGIRMFGIEHLVRGD